MQSEMNEARLRDLASGATVSELLWAPSGATTGRCIVSRETSRLPGGRRENLQVGKSPPSFGDKPC